MKNFKTENYIFIKENIKIGLFSILCTATSIFLLFWLHKPPHHIEICPLLFLFPYLCITPNQLVFSHFLTQSSSAASRMKAKSTISTGKSSSGSNTDLEKQALK